jgi:hypothetical protein
MSCKGKDHFFPCCLMHYVSGLVSCSMGANPTCFDHSIVKYYEKWLAHSGLL